MKLKETRYILACGSKVALKKCSGSIFNFNGDYYNGIFYKEEQNDKHAYIEVCYDEYGNLLGYMINSTTTSGTSEVRTSKKSKSADFLIIKECLHYEKALYLMENI